MEPIPNKYNHHVNLYNRGVAEWNRGNREAALILFRRAIDIKKGFKEAWQALYLGQIKVGDLEGAIQTCREAVIEKPKHQWLWFYLGDAYTANKEYDKAILTFERSLLLWKAYKKPMFGLMRVYRHVGNHKKSKQYRDLMTKPRKEILNLRKRLQNEWKQNKKRNELN
ncbi:MAG: tetratricopeptide repeat protein [Candidatus Thorarchaeota archaeon]